MLKRKRRVKNNGKLPVSNKYCVLKSMCITFAYNTTKYMLFCVFADNCRCAGNSCSSAGSGLEQQFNNCVACLFNSKISPVCLAAGAGSKCRDCVANECTAGAHSQQSDENDEVGNALRELDTNPAFIHSLNEKNVQFVENIVEINLAAAALTNTDASPDTVATPPISIADLNPLAALRCVDDEGEIIALVAERTVGGSFSDVEITVFLGPFATNRFTLNERISVSYAY